MGGRRETMADSMRGLSAQARGGGDMAKGLGFGEEGRRVSSLQRAREVEGGMEGLEGCRVG